MKATERYFLISQEEVDRIDSLVGALNLAITEILESRPIRDHRAENTDHQQQYDELVTPLIPLDGVADARQSEFEF